MNLPASELILVAAIITNGLLAGLFFAFTCAIGPGFRHVDDSTYVRAFRTINTAILNGWFLTVFLAAPLTAIAVAIFHASHGGYPALPLIVGAICSVLTFVVTVTANVPLNRQLDRTPTETTRQRHAARQHFEARWNRWNLTRTITSIGALTCLAVVP